MHPRQDSRIPLEEIIEALVTNNPEMKELDLRTILMNPTVETDFEGALYTVSNIRDEDLLLLANAIEQNTTVERFAVRSRNSSYSRRWTEIGSEAIGNALRNHPTLKSVTLYMRVHIDSEKASLYGFLKCLTGTAKIENLHISLSTAVVLSSRYQNPYRFKNTPEVLNEIGEYLLELKNCDLKRICIEGTSLNGRFTAAPSPVSLVSFARGLAIHSFLEVVDFRYLPLGDTGIREVTHSLLEATSASEEKKAVPLKYKKINFTSCGIQNAVEGVISLAINSANLEEFDLSHNKLQEEAAIKVINSLPILKKLTILYLHKTQMSNKILNHLVTTYLTHTLNIVELYIGGNPIDEMDPSTDLLQKIIRGNKILKVLNLSHSDIGDKHIEALAPVLMDQNLCQLEKIGLTGNQPLKLNKTYQTCLNIIYKNEYLCEFWPPQSSAELQVAYEINMKKKYLREWNTFIDMALCFFNGCFYTKIDPLFNKLPADAISLLFLFLTPSTPSSTINSGYICIDLIRRNLEKRAELRNIKEDNPKNDSKNSAEKNNTQMTISTWWSHALIEEQCGEPQLSEEKKAEPRLLFLSRAIVMPNLMRLPDIVNILTPYIFSAQSEGIPNNAENILIDLSHLAPGKQKYIQDVFSRFFLFMKDRYYSDIPTMSIDEAGKLRINGSTLSNVKKAIRDAQEPVVSEATGCCSMM